MLESSDGLLLPIAVSVPRVGVAARLGLERLLVVRQDELQHGLVHPVPAPKKCKELND